MRRLLLALAALIATAAPAAAEPVAITFDDLPTMALSPTTDYALVTTKALLAGLRRNHIPAIGFVNEVKLEARDKPQRIALLTRWLDAGMTLGNHSYSHPHFSTTPVADYIADVARGEVVTRSLLAARGKPLRWYRHPYLETGATSQDRATFETWLAAHGYRVAPVSMENSDWLFALPYDEAVTRGDAGEAERIRQAYLTFTAQIVPWYRQAALEVLGRRPAFVFLLHATRINADSLGELAAILRANDLKPVTLDRAMTDPAYAIADDYVGAAGTPWVTRWALTLHKDMPWKTLPRPPADIAALDARIEGAVATPRPPPSAR
ncbi:polysaccharide deacetylase family protein [Phenylobacterium sp.]|uniref:polysaccharide deacetylase family protein n=1 Tax=Phenylobacterium sp. TaxID=1871053 RepID=UPI00286B4B3F|nr:polysaccharide deacetylase family protein [Phenylobacterium sp.]